MTGFRDTAGWYLTTTTEAVLPARASSSLEHVLGVDADTIFLKPCRFMDAIGRLNFGDGYEPSFFDHMARLSPQLHRMMAWSGITHSMLFTRAWLRELHEAVEAQHSGKLVLGGLSWRPSILHRVSLGASEAEIYFNFCLRFHPSEVTIRRFNWISAGDLDALGIDRPDYICLRRDLGGGPIDRAKLEQQIAAGVEARQS